MKRSPVSKLIFFLLALLIWACPNPAQELQANGAGASESVPRLIQFNGILKDAAARPVTGPASVTFAIYSEQEGGAALWSETQNVLADPQGHYSAVLGAATAGGFPAELFGTGESRWLGVTVARQTEMPRALLASVPYALKAGDAQTLGGLPASSYVTTQQLAARSSVASSGAAVIATGAVAPASVPASAAGLSVNDSAAAPAASNAVTQATVTGTGTANYLPLWTSGSNLGVSKIYQANGGFVGINTNTPLLQLDVNGNSIFRGSFQMAPQGIATASAGQPSHSFQWQASLYDSSKKAAVNEAFGFRTIPATNNVANPAAQLDLFYGPGGGTLTDTGLSIDQNGIITFSPNQFTDSYLQVKTLTGTQGVYGENYTLNYAAEEGDDYSNGGAGVEGLSYDEGAGYSGDGMVAEGYDGIYAYGANYAGDFDGNVYVGGTLSKAGGSFKIDHPLDPDNKYLSHSFVESPDMMNIYNGNVVTDAKGFATITMPDWFEALNRDFRYQLTAIGQPAQAWVATEIQNKQFSIRTDKPNVKVSWMVTGIRQDAWANAHRIPVEEEKAAADRGHYLHPELQGKPGELNIGERQNALVSKLATRRLQKSSAAQVAGSAE
jgi:hypothetical protein